MTSPMRVLHFHFGKEGGAERFFVNLAEALQRRGVEQRFVIRPRRSWEDQIRPLGPVILNNYRRLSPLSLVLQMQVHHLVRRWRPDAIMAWMPRAARLMPDWPEAVKLARLGDFPRHLEHFQKCDILIGNLPGIGHRCRDLGWHKPMITISNFPRAVTPRQVRRADYGTPEDAFLIVTGGRFVQRKGMDVALRAVARVPEAWLWLVGDGEERPALEALAAELGVTERTRFVGWVDEPIHYIAAGDAFVLPSRHEPLGNVLLEAWQAGVASVSTRSEGPLWYMRDGVDGIMVDIDDVEGMASAFLRYKADPALRTYHVTQATARLAEMFSENAIVAEYLRVFSSSREAQGSPSRLDPMIPV